MALNIKNPEADRLARELAALTGETITEAVVRSLDERLRRQSKPLDWPGGADAYKTRIREIQERVAALPVRDTRSEDEILGYNEFGVFD